MRAEGKLVTVIGAAAMLGGCQSFPLTSWLFKDSRSASEQTVLAGNTAGALEEGRAHLDDGNIAAAVASFKIAQLDASARADATNGLAVAYARLGRPDLAERYFRAAITVDPDNPKYVANLLRLQQQLLLASRREAREPVELAARTPAADAVAAPAEGRLSIGEIERISRNEVRVRSASATAERPAMAVIYRDAAVPALAASDGQQIASAVPTARSATVVFGE